MKRTPPEDRTPWKEASQPPYRRPENIVASGRMIRIRAYADAIAPTKIQPEPGDSFSEWDAWEILYLQMPHVRRREFFDLTGGTAAKKAFLLHFGKRDDVM